jgi:hypothetical protein
MNGKFEVITNGTSSSSIAGPSPKMQDGDGGI